MVSGTPARGSAERSPGWPRRVVSPGCRASPVANSLLPPRPPTSPRTPAEGRAKVPQPVLARASAYHLLGFVANLCLCAPRALGSPAWRSLCGELGLERLLGLALGFRGADTGRRGSRPSAGPAGSAGAGQARSGVVPVDTSGRGLCSDVLTPARIAAVRGRADLSSRRPGENSGSQGNGGDPGGSRVGAFPGLCGPTGAGPGGSWLPI